MARTMHHAAQETADDLGAKATDDTANGDVFAGEDVDDDDLDDDDPDDDPHTGTGSRSDA